MKKSIQKSFVLLLSLLLIVGLIPASVSAASTPGVSYQTHIENIGWEADAGIGIKSNGDTSGTSGRSLRLEGIKINLDSQGYDLGVSYQTHIQDIGWEANAGRGWKSNGVMSGTQGESKRLEAIQIKLTGADADKFDIYYQVHAQNIGWMGWAKNGESAGTAGYSYRLEAIRIQVVPKGTDPPLNSGAPFKDASVVQYKDAYKQVVYQLFKDNGAKYGYSQYACPYSLFDMDSNGIPELFVKKGDCEANYEYSIYTYENGQAKFIGTTNGGHSGLYGQSNNSSGELILLMAHMGYQQVDEINYVNGVITRNTISSGEVPAGKDYYKTDYPVPWAYARDTSLLN
ncbi:hypothetical protein [Acetobacterium paludosum]|uniref:hypothetical protein n=1 Tax=Acetobacterium paludosum TaxID=52693 RepID=UPI001FA967A7|nr:hypothetical protein [Acetobacterium paludosum]